MSRISQSLVLMPLRALMLLDSSGWLAEEVAQRLS